MDHDAIRAAAADADDLPMARVPRLPAPAGATTEPLDVRDPDVTSALVDCVAILDADLLPRVIFRRLAMHGGFARLGASDASLDAWLHPDDRASALDALLRCRAQPHDDIEVHARVNNATDGYHTMRLVFTNLLDHPDVQGIIVRAADETAFEREERWRTLVGESPIGIYEIDLDGRCSFVNPTFARLTNLSATDALGEGWSRAIDPDDLAAMNTAQRRAAALNETCVSELRLPMPDGSTRWLRARSVPLRNHDGTMRGLLGTLEDVTEQHRLEERLEYDATHDRLTGLGSRALLVEQVGAALARTRRGGSGVALLFIDLDGFKRVNDMLGHAAGDELLVQVATRLRNTLREVDVCVRLGGDEFVVCCDMEPLTHSAALADRILATLSAPYDVHGHEMRVGASIGIATAEGEDPVSVDQLLSNADIAAYRAKRRGRGRIEVFDDELRRQLAQGRRIARTVGRLLDAPRLPLLCTPIASLADFSVVGFDCVVDWKTAGLAHTDELVAQVVEEAGMARALDVALVRTLIALLAEWAQAPPGPIVPGLSTVLTRSGAVSPLLAQRVRDMLAGSRAPAALCWLGIPESAVAHDIEAASNVVVALDELGLGVTLRDFGSAVSSLDHLRRLPTRTMTLAGPLVAAAHDSVDDASIALLAAIVRYARALGRIVVALGVQDHAHADALRELGCSFGCGPAFGPTVRPDEVGAYFNG
jgi:diguanylate cyclase (GGDEF)-like protein/PAS domain S-box-containing protein